MAVAVPRTPTCRCGAVGPPHLVDVVLPLLQVPTELPACTHSQKAVRAGRAGGLLGRPDAIPPIAAWTNSSWRPQHPAAAAGPQQQSSSSTSRSSRGRSSSSSAGGGRCSLTDAGGAASAICVRHHHLPLAQHLRPLIAHHHRPRLQVVEEVGLLAAGPGIPAVLRERQGRREQGIVRQPAGLSAQVQPAAVCGRAGTTHT